MKDLGSEFIELLDSQQFDETLLDYSILEKHIDNITRLSELSNNSITIFDNYNREHIYVSPNHAELFGFNEYADLQIHPEDFEHVLRNGVACLRHFFIGNKNAANHKLIREYRVNIKGVYKRITEQIQVLEFDSKGNVWLSICIMDISPNQSPPFKVDSKLINFKTGDFISPVDMFYDSKPILSEREVEVLKMINHGMPSKEIADKLCISVHTVNTHRQRILQKLEVDNSIEAIKYAAALGLLDEY